MIVMDSQGRLGKILVGMNRALGESESFSLILDIECILMTVPLTVKFVCLPPIPSPFPPTTRLWVADADEQRTGVANGKPNAHKLIPKFATEWGASAMTVSHHLPSIPSVISSPPSLYPHTLRPFYPADALRPNR
jgi:tRNA-dihydrouridine synthase 3